MKKKHLKRSLIPRIVICEICGKKISEGRNCVHHNSMFWDIGDEVHLEKNESFLNLDPDFQVYERHGK